MEVRRQEKENMAGRQYAEKKGRRDDRRVNREREGKKGQVKRREKGKEGALDEYQEHHGDTYDRDYAHN